MTQAVADTVTGRCFSSINDLWESRSYAIAEALVVGLYPAPLASTELVAATKAWLAVMEGGPGAFSDLLWRHVDGAPRINRWRNVKEVPAETKESRAMAKALKQAVPGLRMHVIGFDPKPSASRGTSADPNRPRHGPSTELSTPATTLCRRPRGLPRATICSP